MGLRRHDEIKMTWTEITRAQYRRDDLEYASDQRWSHPFGQLYGPDKQ